jgi:hypothetical protein
MGARAQMGADGLEAVWLFESLAVERHQGALRCYAETVSANRFCEIYTLVLRFAGGFCICSLFKSNNSPLFDICQQVIFVVFRLIGYILKMSANKH